MATFSYRDVAPEGARIRSRKHNYHPSPVFFFLLFQFV